MGRPRWLGMLVVAVVHVGCARRQPPSPDACEALRDPLQRVVTLNSDGQYSEATFTLPAGVYILVPHPLGLDAPYRLASPLMGQSFEEMLSSQALGLLPLPSSGGWRLYEPGDLVHNIRLTPWSRSADRSKEYASWIKVAPEEDRASVALDTDRSPPAFAVVPARDSGKRALNYHGRSAMKVKIFGPTDLETVVQRLGKRDAVGPVVLAPFTCNSKPSQDSVAVTIDPSKTVSFPGVAGCPR